MTKWVQYLAFVGFVAGALLMARPKPDLFPLDYGLLSSGYSSLLAGLGGFAITVLAVMLGLEALDDESSSPIHVAAHGAVLRHVALSLAVASITCFAGALLLSEVAAQTSSVERARSGAVAEIERTLAALDVPEPLAAKLMLDLDQARAKDPYFRESSPTERVLSTLRKDPTIASSTVLKSLEERASTLDKILTGSTRRHTLIANVVALLSSLLILKSITFLLVVRFPDFPSIGRVQDFVVLAFGGMLLVKLLHLASYGLDQRVLAFTPWLVASAMLGTIGTYRSLLGRKVESLRESVVQGELGKFTPVAPYSLALIICFACMVYLAATFSNLGSPGPIDRAFVALAAILGSSLLVTVQVERPTLDLFTEVTRTPETRRGAAID